MRTFEYDLSKYEKIKGKLVLIAPTFRQRMKLVEECGFELGADGKGVSNGSNNLKSFNKLLDRAPKFFKEVDVKHDEKTHAKSFDDLENYPEFDTILTESALAILSAGQLGN